LREASWAQNSCHSVLSAMASSSRPCATPGRCSPCSNSDGATSNAGSAAWDVDASPSCARHCDITQSSDRTTSTPGAGSGAGPDDLLDRPLLGAESPPVGALTTLRPLVDRLSERVRPHPWWGSRGTIACVAAATVSSCCGLAAAVVACGSWPATTTLAVVCGALSERRLVASDVLSLSALVGARAGTAGNALTTKERQGMSGYISKSEACGKGRYLL
jgi:hypothetical protein